MIGPNLSEWAISKRSFVIFLMLVSIAAGTFAFLKLGRAEDPVFTFRTMIVQARWPGATQEELLKQVTERLERQLQETRWIDTVRSYTTPGVTTIFVDLKGATPPDIVPDIWYEVRRNIGDMRHTLPQGVLGPFFNDDFGATFGIIYGFTADGFSKRELRDYVEKARSKLLAVPDVEKIELIGEQDEQIFLEFSTERLAGLGLDYSAIARALAAQNLVRPSGVIQAANERVSLRVSGSFENERDIEEFNFQADGRLVRLGDIAEVRRGFVDPPAPMFRVNGQPAIGLGIAMRDNGDILALGENIRGTMKEFTADLPLGIQPFLVADQAHTVDTAINEFITSLWQAILIIMAASFVALGVRPGSVVALAIPLTLAIVFVVMSMFGIDLHRISLGALIIALTLLVDDAMTTIDAMIRRLGAGDSMEKAATFAYKTLAAPMLIGTLVTIAGFVPIGFARSSAGEYTFAIFAVVAIALIVSWFVAVIFAPLIGMAILKPPKEGAKDPPPGRVLRGYASFLQAAIRFRWVTIAVTIAAFAGAVFLMRYVPSQFFPASDRPELLVDLTLPQNSSIYATEATASRIEAELAKDDGIAHWSTYIGRGAIRFYLPLNAQLANPFFAQIVIVAKDVTHRDRLEEKLEKLLAEQFPEVSSRVSPLELGPPVGWPLQYRVTGPDIEQVRSIALDVAQVLGGDTRARLVNFDWMEPSREMRVKIDQDEARRLGVTSSAIANVLNAAVSGSPVTQVRDDIYLINVVARAVDEQRASLTAMRNLQVPLPNGRIIPLSQFASFEYDQEYPLIWRRDRLPTLTVQADLVAGILPDEVVSTLAPKIAELNTKLPRGYKVATGGIYEESAESQASVAAVLPIMVLLMLTTMMLLLVSFRRLAMVVSLLPLGLIGVVLALLVSGRPLGFVAILGILSLMGMIAKNAVILIVQIESDRAEGRTVQEAVLSASTSRLRPMMLTAISTVLGLIPIAPTVFWGPMAFAIMGGLLVATLLTLVFLPTLYVTMIRDTPAPRTEPPAAAG